MTTDAKYRDHLNEILRHATTRQPPRDDNLTYQHGARWNINWKNPDADPLRKAILGLGPKRPYRK